MPKGGVTARLLRSAPIQRLVRQVQKQLRKNVDVSISGHGLGRMAHVAERPGRRGRPDRYYLLWAERYVKALEHDTKRPVAYLAERYGLKPTQVRDLIHKARERGLLTKSRRGQASGRLTEEAKDLLRRKDDHR